MDAEYTNQPSNVTFGSCNCHNTALNSRKSLCSKGIIRPSSTSNDNECDNAVVGHICFNERTSMYSDTTCDCGNESTEFNFEGNILRSQQIVENHTNNLSNTSNLAYRENRLWGVLDSVLPELYRVFNINKNMQIMEDPPITAELEEGLVISGGFQQYLIRNRGKLGVETEQPRKGRGSDDTTFHDLPDSLQLHIFSFLSASDLCRIATVSRHWLMLGSDDLLWKHLLKLDSKKWHVIGHNTNPSMYEECQSDWSYKDIYLRCSPEVNRLVRQQNLNFHHLSTILRSLWPKKTPRVAMFGPGLESETSGLTRKIIEHKVGLFEATGMFPGQFDGVGSGFTMKITSSGLLFNLVTLYTSTRDERERHQNAERLQHSRLLATRSNADGVEGVEPHYELQEPIRNLCRTLDGLIFVVDASQSEETIAFGRPELMAMVSEMWANPDIPVLVLACVPEYRVTRAPCVNIVEFLQLGKLNRPWQVHDSVVDSLAGVQQGIQWLIEQTQRR